MLRTFIHRSRKGLACGLAALLLGLGALHGPVASNAPAAHLSAGAAVRSGPGEHYLMLAVTETRADYPILGRSRDGQWWRIDYCGLPAWVAAAQVTADAADAPVVQVGGKQF